MRKPKHVIRKADTQVESTRIVLMHMQAEALPWDDPFPLDKALWWIAYCGDKPVGFCALSESTSDDGLGELARSGVTKAHQGYGLQREFIRVREKEAKRQGITRLIATTMPDNEPSSNNLIASGYRLYAPREGRANASTIYWQKRI